MLNFEGDNISPIFQCFNVSILPLKKNPRGPEDLKG
jgi:hypothetical protein